MEALAILFYIVNIFFFVTNVLGREQNFLRILIELKIKDLEK